MAQRLLSLRCDQRLLTALALLTRIIISLSADASRKPFSRPNVTLSLRTSLSYEQTRVLHHLAEPLITGHSFHFLIQAKDLLPLSKRFVTRNTHLSARSFPLLNHLSSGYKQQRKGESACLDIWTKRQQEQRFKRPVNLRFLLLPEFPDDA